MDKNINWVEAMEDEVFNYTKPLYKKVVVRNIRTNVERTELVEVDKTVYHNPEQEMFCIIGYEPLTIEVTDEQLKKVQKYMEFIRSPILPVSPMSSMFNCFVGEYYLSGCFISGYEKLQTYDKKKNSTPNIITLMYEYPRNKDKTHIKEKTLQQLKLEAEQKAKDKKVYPVESIQLKPFDPLYSVSQRNDTIIQNIINSGEFNLSLKFLTDWQKCTQQITNPTIKIYNISNEDDLFDYEFKIDITNLMPFTTPYNKVVWVDLRDDNNTLKVLGKEEDKLWAKK